MAAVAGTKENSETELTRALIELDAAWEAHAMLKVSLEKAEADATSLKKLRNLERSQRDAFEKISTVIWNWSQSSSDAQRRLATTKLRQIQGIIEDARVERTRIAEIQRKRQEA